MDISNLKFKQHLLMNYLSKVGYSANKQRNIEKCIELVLNRGSFSNITSYEDLFFQEVQEQGYTPESYRFNSLRASLGQLKNFDLYGKYPDGNYTRFTYDTNNFNKLNDYYKLLAAYSGDPRSPIPVISVHFLFAITVTGCKISTFFSNFLLSYGKLWIIQRLE